MKIQKSLFVGVLLLGNTAFAQVGKSLEGCEAILGQPIKIHSAATPPARLYLHEGLHVQISFDTGKAVAAIYRIPSPSGNETLSSSNVKEVYALNGFTDEQLIPIHAGLPTQLKGLYKMTEDKKLLVLNDPNENVIVVQDAEAYFKRLE